MGLFSKETTKSDKPKFAFRIGDRVKDKLTGFTGIVGLKQDCISGCNLYSVDRDEAETSGFSSQDFDETRLAMVTEQEVREPEDLNDFKFALGQRVRDKVTGYTGIVTSRGQQFSTDNRYGVQTLSSTGESVSRGFDENQLEPVDAPKKEIEKPTNRSGAQPMLRRERIR